MSYNCDDILSYFSVFCSYGVDGKHFCRIDTDRVVCAELEIPSIICGHPVTSLVGGADERSNMSLRSLTIPSSAKSISLSAFSWCHCLENISIPDSFIYVDIKANVWPPFFQDHKIQEIIVRFGESDDWLNMAICIFYNVSAYAIRRK